MSIGEQIAEITPTTVVERTASQRRLAGWLFGSVIFLSAFLLFLVQPILGKIILPWFGGSAGVWAACLLYFQASLLAGYAYAHGLRRFLRPDRQMQVHILLLVASIFLLPILPSPAWRNLGHADPAIRILGLLAATIGLPYLLVCSTSPLLQAWYAAIKPGASAYRFYALSNLGSLLGLICFPLVVEPRLPSRVQAWSWSGAYVVFVLLGTVVAWYAWKHRAVGDESDVSGRETTAATDRVPFLRSLLWLGLAACGSALMMAVTNHLSQNVAPIPMLWILPLGLYLLSFVLCFDTDRAYKRLIWIPAMVIGLSAMAWVMFYHQGTTDLRKSIPSLLVGLFACCMVCHGELARHKPAPRFLTYFYLLTSAGGVLGGFFVAILAPHIFKTYTELPLWMGLCALLVTGMVWKQTRGRPLSAKARVAMVSFTLALTAYMAVFKHRTDRKFFLHARNFYGVLQVQDLDGGPADGQVRSLLHGTIEHGAQLLDPYRRHEPTLYYLRSSGVGLAMRYINGRSPQVHVGAIGLGAGVVASYCRIGDVYRFYEINPEVVKIANSQFTFLQDCHGNLDVQLGDARLTLESEEPQDFDLLVVDAFSGDAIPIHLITREAFQEYFRHLKSDGILAVHISNKYLDLAPVVSGIAQELGKTTLAIYDPAGGDDASYPSESDWILVTSNPQILDNPVFDVDYAEDTPIKKNMRVWTDDYSNVLQILDVHRVTKEEDEEDQ